MIDSHRTPAYALPAVQQTPHGRQNPVCTGAAAPSIELGRFFCAQIPSMAGCRGTLRGGRYPVRRFLTPEQLAALFRVRTEAGGSYPSAQETVMSDIHSVLFETKAYVEGLRNLTAECRDGSFNYLTPFQLDRLLEPISNAMESALVALEKDRKERRR